MIGSRRCAKVGIPLPALPWYVGILSERGGWRIVVCRRFLSGLWWLKWSVFSYKCCHSSWWETSTQCRSDVGLTMHGRYGPKVVLTSAQHCMMIFPCSFFHPIICQNYSVPKSSQCWSSSGMVTDLLHTLRPRQNGRHFPMHFEILEWKYINLIKILLKFVSKGTIDNIPVLVQAMAWRAGQVTSHYLNQW